MIRKSQKEIYLHVEDEFRDMLFKKAYENVGSRVQLGRKLGYTGPAPNYYVNRMWRGEQPMTLHRLEVLSEMTGIPMAEILNHSVPVSIRRKRRTTRELQV